MAVVVGVGGAGRQRALDDGNQKAGGLLAVDRQFRKQHLERFRADIDEQIGQDLGLVAGVVRKNADRDGALLKLGEAEFRIGVALLLCCPAQSNLSQRDQQAEARGPQQVRPCPDQQRALGNQVWQPRPARR